MTKPFLLIFLVLSSFSYCQTADYSDVAVIINSNSQTSIDIGEYFQSARNIPNQNMIYISAPTSEEIDSATFEGIRTQIEDYLTVNNLEDSINYLVTTKGIPLKVVNTCFFQQTGVVTISCASVDSELCLILSSNAGEIGVYPGVLNPLYEQTQPFSRSVYDVYLVTRLTGYSKEDVYSLIDRSGPQTGVNQVSAQALLDINNSDSMDIAFYETNMITPAEDYLTSNSWNSTVHPDTTPILNQDIVFAHMAYGSGYSYNVNLNHTWTEGSVGCLETCNSAPTFELSSNPDGQFTIGDMIADGCTGAHGLVNCNFFSLLFKAEIFFDRYLDPNNEYNLAESFYMAEPRMSWQAIVVGDPKASLVIDNTATTEDLKEISLTVYPNPSNGTVHISADKVISTVEIYTTNGAVVKSLDAINSSSIELDLRSLEPGMYLVKINSGNHQKMERIILTE